MLPHKCSCYLPARWQVLRDFFADGVLLSLRSLFCSFRKGPCGLVTQSQRLRRIFIKTGQVFLERVFAVNSSLNAGGNVFQNVVTCDKKLFVRNVRAMDISVTRRLYARNRYPPLTMVSASSTNLKGSASFNEYSHPIRGGSIFSGSFSGKPLIWRKAPISDKITPVLIFEIF